MKKNDIPNENVTEDRPEEMDQEKNSIQNESENRDAPDNEYYEYPGIEVTDRKVNRWLIAVYVILAGWSIYYLISFWNG